MTGSIQILMIVLLWPCYRLQIVILAFKSSILHRIGLQQMVHVNWAELWLNSVTCLYSISPIMHDAVVDDIGTRSATMDYAGSMRALGVARPAIITLS